MLTDCLYPVLNYHFRINPYYINYRGGGGWVLESLPRQT